MVNIQRIYLLVIAVVSIIGGPSVLAQKIYWTEENNARIMVGNLTPNGISASPTTLITGISNCRNIAIDRFQNQIFYTSGGGQILTKANLSDGSLVELINKGNLSGYSEISYSANANGVYGTGTNDTPGTYFISETGGAESSLSLDGVGGDMFLGTDVHDGNEQVYFIRDFPRSIYKTNDLSGSTASQIIAMDGIENIVADEIGNKLYFTVNTGSTNLLYSTNLDGSSPTLLSSSIGSGQVTAIQVYSTFDKIYFVKQNDGIYSTNLDGSGLTELLNLAGTSVWDIAILEDFNLPIFVNPLVPADNSVNVPATSVNLTLTFNEQVKVSITGLNTDPQTLIRVFRSSDNFIVETINRSSVSIAGNVATITLSDLEYSKDYYILIGDKVVSDLSGNNWIGISQSTSWNFTTEVDQSKFYSRQSGNWNDVNSWSHVSHTGPAVTNPPGTGSNAELGSGHTIKLTANQIITGDLIINAGSNFDFNGFVFETRGNFTIGGNIKNGPNNFGGTLTGSFTLNSTNGTPIFTRIDYGIPGPAPSTATLNTNVIVLNGIQPVSGQAILQANGKSICDASIAPPANPVFSNLKSNSVTLSWGNGASDAFIVARAGSTSFKPNFQTLYNANAAFGSGDFVGTGNTVAYKGTGNSVTLTNLNPGTNYEFDLYSYSTLVGGCYSVSNYQFATITTCANLPAPIKPVNNSFCAGSSTVAIAVDDPGAGKIIKWFDAAVVGNVAVGTTAGLRNQLFTPTAAGTYYAELGDGAGCSSTTRTPVTLTQNPLPVVIDPTPNPLCESTPGSGTTTASLTSFNAAIIGGASNTSVTWYSNSARTILITNPGSVLISNNQTFYAYVENTATTCKTPTKITFTVAPKPTVFPHAPTICETVVGGGTAIVNLQDHDANVTGGAANVIVEWYKSGSAVTNPNNIIVSNGEIFSVVVRNTVSACLNNSTVTFTIKPKPRANAIAGIKSVCLDATKTEVYQLNPNTNPSSNYTWTITGSAFAIINGGGTNTTNSSAELRFAAPGAVNIQVSESLNGCEGNANTLSVTIISPPTGVGTILGKSLICTASEETYSISGISLATSYVWTLGSNITKVSQTDNTMVVTAQSGNLATITVVGKNDCGTSAMANKDIAVTPKPEVSISLPSDVIVNEPANFSFSTPATIQNVNWLFGDGGSSFENAPQYTYILGGDFLVQLDVRDNAGCLVTLNKSLRVDGKPELTDFSIKNVVTANGDTKNDFLYIERIDIFPNNEVILLDRWGTVVFKTKGYANDWDLKKGGNYLPAGNYVCIVKLVDTGKVFKRTVTVVKGN